MASVAAAAAAADGDEDDVVMRQWWRTTSWSILHAVAASPADNPSHSASYFAHIVLFLFVDYFHFYVVSFKTFLFYSPISSPAHSLPLL